MQATKLIVISLIIIATIAGAGFGIKHIISSYVDTDHETPTTTPSVDIGDLQEWIAGSTAGKLNVLLLGISGEDHISGELTDSIIFASINFEEDKFDLFSIPRDLWVQTENGGSIKINELYKEEGGTPTPDVSTAGQIKEKVEEVTGQKINNTAIINLEGIRQLVDEVGGVETDEGFMNGEEALFYIRDRSRPGSDFDRMRRQQQLIEAVVQKLSDEGTIQDQQEISELLEILQNNLATDMDILQSFSFANRLGNFDNTQTGLYTITTNNLLQEELRNIEGQQIYILYPTAGEQNYTEIQNFINETIN